jgi:hypothetical protein
MNVAGRRYVLKRCPDDLLPELVARAGSRCNLLNVGFEATQLPLRRSTKALLPDLHEALMNGGRIAQ